MGVVQFLQPVPLSPQRALSEVALALIQAVNSQGEVLLDLDLDGTTTAVWASVAGAIDESSIGRTAVVMFIAGEWARPLVIGLVHSGDAAQARAAAEAAPPAAAAPEKRVVVEAGDALTLKCGKASLTMQKNGRMILRGTDIASYASGTQRINGAIVEVN